MKTTIERRSFIIEASTLATGLVALSARGSKRTNDEESRFIIEAAYYDKLPYKKIRCRLCPRECEIDEAERGYCGVRENRNGTYYSLVYSRPCTYHVDPVEKKPFFHFLPGTLAFSIATAGCNVNCKFCQNWQISQVRPEQARSLYLPPNQVTEMAIQSRSRSIAYTYSEPVIFYEFMRDTAIAAREKGVKSLVVTGAYIAQQPLKELCSLVDAIKVDLKSFSEKYYSEIVNGELKPVLDALVTMRKKGIWLEIVYLVVPTLNDSDNELKNLAKWIRQELGPEVPVHFSRFYPMYLLKNLPPTPVSTLEKAQKIAKAEGLKYVYVGNVPGHPAEDTYCPNCGRKLVERSGYRIQTRSFKDGRCAECNQEIAGVWS